MFLFFLGKGKALSLLLGSLFLVLGGTGSSQDWLLGPQGRLPREGPSEGPEASGNRK